MSLSCEHGKIERNCYICFREQESMQKLEKRISKLENFLKGLNLSDVNFLKSLKSQSIESDTFNTTAKIAKCKCWQGMGMGCDECNSKKKKTKTYWLNVYEDLLTLPEMCAYKNVIYGSAETAKTCIKELYGYRYLKTISFEIEVDE